MIDLHMHTIFSDGSVLPEDLVNLAVENKLEAIAITDHDTTESLPFAQKAAAQKAAEGHTLEIIPGIEVNTVWKDKEIHVLGYYIDPENQSLKDVIQHHRDSRVIQIQEMAQKLKLKAKLNITYEDIVGLASDSGTIGRPHVAKAIVAKGGAHNISQAFSKFLNPKCETYVRRKTVPPHEAVEAGPGEPLRGPARVRRLLAEVDVVAADPLRDDVPSEGKPAGVEALPRDRGSHRASRRRAHAARAFR